MQFLNKVVDMPVVVRRQVPMVRTVLQNRGGSAVAVHRQDHPGCCLDAEADPRGADDSEDLGDSTVAAPSGSTGAGRAEDHRQSGGHSCCATAVMQRKVPTQNPELDASAVHWQVSRCVVMRDSVVWFIKVMVDITVDQQ